MISIETYRVSIGCFATRIFSRTSFIKRAYRGYYNDILLMSRFSSIFKFLSPDFMRMKLITTIFVAVVILLMSGDIETNPGPYTILKSVQGLFHQGDPRLGESVGTQCVCNSLFAIVMSVIKNIFQWNSSDLDLILCEGTHLYRSLGYSNQYLSVDDLANRIIFENEVLDIQNLENTAHILKYSDDDSVLNTFYNSSDSDKGHGMLCIINGVSFAKFVGISIGPTQ